MTAADPEGRVRHLLDVMHKTFDDAGDPIAAGMVPVADGLGQVDYVDSSTFGSTAAVDITITDAGGYFTAANVEAALQELASKDIGYQAHGNTGSTETFSALTGWHSATVNVASTFTFSGATSGIVASMILELAEGGFAVTWPGSVVWPGGVAPTLSTSGTDLLTFFSRDGGTTWYGFMAGAAGTSTTINTAVYGLHAHVADERHLSNGSATTYTLDQAFEPGSVIAWNITTLARLGVTEAQPDQATVSAAGSSGDTITFDYAATLTV